MKQTLGAHVLESQPEAAWAFAGMEAGWTQSLERLAELVAKAQRRS